MSLSSLKRRLKAMQEENAPGIGACPRPDNFYIWDAYIHGPEGTIWEGGKFQLQLWFPSEFPLSPPKVRFVSRMFHPNVYPDGSICMDVLEEQWSPALFPHKILLSMQSILNDPNTDSPANAEAAYLFCTNKREYDRRVHAIVEDSLTSD